MVVTGELELMRCLPAAIRPSITWMTQIRFPGSRIRTSRIRAMDASSPGLAEARPRTSAVTTAHTIPEAWWCSAAELMGGQDGAGLLPARLDGLR
jgi:hypothetical protein